MDFQPVPYSAELLKAGEDLFGGQTTFMLGVAHLEQLPFTELNEVAFAGRSNVGKSSLINAITAQKGLAKTSNTPGTTQQLNYFNVGDRILMVDLPGYGYAQAPEALVKQWQKLIFTYLQGRVNLKRVFVLIDSRHGIKKVDEEIMDMLDKAAVTYQIILTKSDKISQAALAKVLSETEQKTAQHPAAYIKVLTTSSEKNAGIENVRAEIASLVMNLG